MNGDEPGQWSPRGVGAIWLLPNISGSNTATGWRLGQSISAASAGPATRARIHFITTISRQVAAQEKHGRRPAGLEIAVEEGHRRSDGRNNRHAGGCGPRSRSARNTPARSSPENRRGPARCGNRRCRSGGGPKCIQVPDSPESTAPAAAQRPTASSRGSVVRPAEISPAHSGQAASMRSQKWRMRNRCAACTAAPRWLGIASSHVAGPRDSPPSPPSSARLSSFSLRAASSPRRRSASCPSS